MTNQFDENSWIENELPKIKKYFSTIEKTLNSFANNYGMLIEKYYHYSPSWNFLFRHSDEGLCNIEVSKADEKHVMINASWWIDDYESNIRYSARSDGMKSAIEKDELENVLKSALESVLSIDKNRMESYQGHQPAWSEMWSEDEFKSGIDKYPVLKNI